MIDQTLDCKFKINKEICNNGIKSQVYKVTELPNNFNNNDNNDSSSSSSSSSSSQTTYAAKTIASYLKDSQYDLRPEFEIQSKMKDHKNILQVYELIESGQLMSQYFGGKQVMYLTMEYCQHGDLLEFIQKNCPVPNNKSAVKSLDLNIVRQIYKQVLEAVEFVHNQGFVHRDLKLENILIGNDGLLKLADFGCAKSTSENDLTEVKGTEYYMSPEIIQNSYTSKKQIYNGEKVDVFSMGVILFSLIFNQHPFRKAHLRDCNYRFIVEHKYEKFWDSVKGKLKEFSQEDQDNIKELIESMFQYSPDQRCTLEQVRKSKFLANEENCISVEELKALLLNNNNLN